MKITIKEDQTLQETEVIIHCHHTDEQILRLLSLLQTDNRKLTGSKNGNTFILETSKILYIDTVDKKSFFYTETDVYETPLKLYELEERLKGEDFFRASKSSIVNFRQIKSLRPEFGGRMILTLNNNEQLFVSRGYTAAIKQKLGLIQIRRSIQ